MASFTKNGILINEQFGFCSGRSVNLQLLDLVSYLIYINKNVNVRLFLISNLRKFFTDCFEILIQRCIRIRACFYIPTII